MKIQMSVFIYIHQWLVVSFRIKWHNLALVASTYNYCPETLERMLDILGTLFLHAFNSSKNNHYKAHYISLIIADPSESMNWRALGEPPITCIYSNLNI